MIGLLLAVIVLLIFNDVTFYNKQILWTHKELMRARLNLLWFKEQTDKLPNSLVEIKQYAAKNSNSMGHTGYDFLRTKLCREFLSDANGCTKEYNVLNGEGGWYYNKNTGEVKVNLNRPLKHYLKFYLGRERNSAPSSW